MRASFILFWRQHAVSLFMLGAVLAVTLAALSAQGADEPRTVTVVARRFAFEPAEITATVGEPLRLVITSADGVHGLEIKKFKVKKEIPRGGEAAVVTFTPNAAGSFPILCSEYCGEHHDDMKGMLVVTARDAATPQP